MAANWPGGASMWVSLVATTISVYIKYPLGAKSTYARGWHSLTAPLLLYRVPPCRASKFLRCCSPW